MRLIRKTRFFWVYPLAIWLFISARITEQSFRVGMLIVFLGEALRLWANGYVGHVKVNWTKTWRQEPKIGQLITAGPYAYVRHPLYVGTFIIGLGFGVIVRNVWLACGALVFFAFVYQHKARKEEDVVLSHECGEAYAAYRQAVPRWFPTCRRYPNRNGTWDWRGVLASKELRTLVWIVVCLVLLYFKAAWSPERGGVTGEEVIRHLPLVMLCLVLIAGDVGYELFKRVQQKAKVLPECSAQ